MTNENGDPIYKLTVKYENVAKCTLLDFETNIEIAMTPLDSNCTKIRDVLFNERYEPSMYNYKKCRNKTESGELAKIDLWAIWNSFTTNPDVRIKCTCVKLCEGGRHCHAFPPYVYSN